MMAIHLIHPTDDTCEDSGKEMYFDPPVERLEGSKPEDFLPIICGGCGKEWSEK